MNPFLLQRPFLTVLTAALAAILSLSASAAMAAKDALELLPDSGDPSVTVTTPKPRQEITQTREQNAVTSVRVREGNNTYYVKPPEQSADGHSGARAAQWQVYEFKPRQERSNVPPPPGFAR